MQFPVLCIISFTVIIINIIKPNFFCIIIIIIIIWTINKNTHVMYDFIRTRPQVSRTMKPKI